MTRAWKMVLMQIKRREGYSVPSTLASAAFVRTVDLDQFQLVENGNSINWDAHSYWRKLDGTDW
jgi:hypothetical protein